MLLWELRGTDHDRQGLRSEVRQDPLESGDLLTQVGLRLRWTVSGKVNTQWEGWGSGMCLRNSGF